MSRASRRLEVLFRNDESLRTVVRHAVREKASRRIYGHVFSEVAHYLNRAASYRREGRIDTALAYVKGARSILRNGTNWTITTNKSRIKLP